MTRSEFLGLVIASPLAILFGKRKQETYSFIATWEEYGNNVPMNLAYFYSDWIRPDGSIITSDEERIQLACKRLEERMYGVMGYHPTSRGYDYDNR